jgi:hypothetical protein
MKSQSFYEPLVKTVFRVMCGKPLRKAALSCVWTALRFFFLPQYKAVLFPKVTPVSRADHPLDKHIPFNPRWVNVYLDFVAFWVRLVGCILVYYGRKGTGEAIAFIKSIEGLYAFAVQVYRKNLSTTDRPRYLKRFRFLMIHAFDPHLMCIPSLHVMIVIRSYTKFRQILNASQRVDEEPEFIERETERIIRGALDITQAVLYVKQHSVNCVSAAMYAMSRFDPPLFPPSEAAVFTERLFSPGGASPGGTEIRPEDIPVIRKHIVDLYHSFLEASSKAEDWTEPLLRFLRNLTLKSKNN